MFHIIHSLHTLHRYCVSIYTKKIVRRNNDYLSIAYYIQINGTKHIVMTVNSSAISHFSYARARITLSPCIFGLIILQSIAFMRRAYYVLIVNCFWSVQLSTT
jgi:hypothetical protein